ncbi:MAG: hypothetical protein IT493_12340 [Gammaproteobacteria bacterium]|nr:hypothetical protein [Gammaproteobacteria bacterium]
MACCVIALAMVYRLIDTWRRTQAWIAGVPVAAGRVWRAPLLRRAVVAVAVIECIVVGALVWQHRQHLSDAGGRLLVASSGIAANLCRTVPPVRLISSHEE